MGWRSKLKTTLHIHNQTLRETMAEFLGTFVLILFGDGSVAQWVLSQKNMSDFLSVNVAWGIAVTMGIYVSGGVSGGHINPAVSLTMGILGRLPFWKVPLYILAQYIGAFAASACVFGVYYDALNAMPGGPYQVNVTAGIWATYPQNFVTTGTGLADQILGTAILVICVLAITDEKNMGTPKGLVPLSVGMVVLGIGVSFGFNCGYGINPARDFAPRLFTYVAGWGSGVFSAHNYWFWVPIVGPHIGAVLGAWIYLLCVGIHHEATDDTVEKPELASTPQQGLGEYLTSH